MWCLFRNLLLLFDLLHQAVEVLVHFVIMGNLVLPLAVFERLDIRMHPSCQPVLLGLFGLLALTLGLHLPVQVLLGLHLLLLAVICLYLLSLCLSIILYLRVMVNTLEVLLELVIPGDAHGEHVLAEGAASEAPVLDEFDASLVDLCELPRLVVLLREDGGEDVVGLLGRTLVLLLLLVELGALLDLLLVGGQGPLLLLPLGSLMVSLLVLQLLLDPAESVELPALLLLHQVLSACMLLDLLVPHDLLLLHHPLDIDLLLSLVTLLLLLLSDDIVEVLEVAPLGLDLGLLVLLHLPEELLADPRLVLLHLQLDRILVLLELLHVVHDDLSPVVSILA